MKTTENAVSDTKQYTESNKNEDANKDSVSSRLLSFIYKLDTEFPLSGGETQEEMSGSIEYMAHEAHTLLDGIDANFPLSGGN